MNARLSSGGTRRWLTRLGWLLLIWVCSVGALSAAAWLMRIVIRAGGLTA
jgi:hypothetical protein